MRATFALLLGGVAALLTGCSSLRAPDSQVTSAASDPDPVVVETAAAQKRDLKDTVTLAGTTAPYQQVTLYARTTGYLRRLTVDIGDAVRQGELIAQLEVPEMETRIQEKKAALREAEASLEEARAKLEQSRAEAEFAGINFRRLKSIHDRDADVLPQQDVDQALASQSVALGKQKSAETGVHAAEAAIAAGKAQLATLETMMRYSVIQAPLSGVVTQRFVDPGALIQVAAASRTQTAPVVTIAQLNRLRIFADAPEPSSPFVRAGTPVTIEVPDLPGEKIETHVIRTSEALDPSSRTLRVEVDVENPKAHLRPGMTARVSLLLRDWHGAVTVPVNAVRTQGNTRTIYILEGDRARAVVVKTGLESPEWIQIVTGLQGGEKVITSAVGELKEGVRVRVR